MYDQFWLKAGRPDNISIVEIDLNLNGPGHLKDLIYGSQKSEIYDGVHLKGVGAHRHYNYRAKQAIRPIIERFSKSLSQQDGTLRNRQRPSYSDTVKTMQGRTFLGENMKF